MAGNGYLEVRCRNAVLNGEFGKGGRFGSAVPEPNSAWLPWQCCVVHRPELWQSCACSPGFGAFPGLLHSQSGRQEAMPRHPPPGRDI